MKAVVITLGVALVTSGCAGSIPDLAGIVPQPPPPVIVAECLSDNPPEPGLPAEFDRLDARAKERAVLKAMEARRLDRGQLAAWRMTCRASLRAQFPASVPGRGKADRPTS